MVYRMTRQVETWLSVGLVTTVRFSIKADNGLSLHCAVMLTHLRW